MKLFEIEDKEDKIPFDVVEDLAIFMRNDPMFYRKTFFPAMAQVSDKMERGESIDPAIFIKPMVDKGVKSYCKKFIKDKRPEDVFTDEDKDTCCKKIQSEEIPLVKKGIYKECS